MLKMYREQGLEGMKAAQAAFAAQGERWMTDEAFRSFEILDRAATAVRSGNLDQARALQADAARECLYHEQKNILQKMYDRPDFAAALAQNQRWAENPVAQFFGARPVEVVFAADLPGRETDIRVKFSSDPKANLGDLERWRTPYVNRVLDTFVRESRKPNSTIWTDLRRMSTRR